MSAMKEPTMLYRKGTEIRLHGVFVDTKIVDADQIEDHLTDGWHRTPTAVREAEAAKAAAADAAAQKAAAKAARQNTVTKPEEPGSDPIGAPGV